MTPAAAGAQRRRHAEAAGNRRRAEFAKTVETEPIAVIPHDAKLFGSAANNGQMIAEIEPNGKTAQIFTDLASAHRGPRRGAQGQKRRSRPVHGQTRRARRNDRLANAALDSLSVAQAQGI